MLPLQSPRHVRRVTFTACTDVIPAKKRLSMRPYRLGPFVDQFVRASAGKPDLGFWRSFYKSIGHSGGPSMNGHLVVLFPYVRPQPGFLSDSDGASNPLSARRVAGRTERPPVLPPDGLTRSRDGFGPNSLLLRSQPAQSAWVTTDDEARDELEEARHGILTSAVPGGFSVAPFEWNYFDHDFPMEFLAGFVGVSQDRRTLALRPEVGWAVRDRTKKWAEGWRDP